jgi:hypothetical protein
MAVANTLAYHDTATIAFIIFYRTDPWELAHLGIKKIIKLFWNFFLDTGFKEFALN